MHKSCTMEKQLILQSDLLDILFDGKNKDYGAYDLRKTYHERIRLALIGTILISALFVALALSAIGSGKTIEADYVVDISLASINDEIKKVEPIPPVKKVLLKVEVVAVTPPLIVKDEEVKPEDEVQSVDAIDDTKIGSFNQEGEKSAGIVTAPVEQALAGFDIRKEEDGNMVFTTVQIPAEFPGGVNGWSRFLQRNLNSDIPLDNGAPAGKYTVVVSFVVDKTGAISEVVAENDPGFGTKAEAVRVITRGPAWKPAIQNGQQVKYRHRQSITFQVADE